MFLSITVAALLPVVNQVVFANNGVAHHHVVEMHALWFFESIDSVAEGLA